MSDQDAQMMKTLTMIFDQYYDESVYRKLQYVFYLSIILISIILMHDTSTWPNPVDWVLPAGTLVLLIILSSIQIFIIRFPEFVEKATPSSSGIEERLDDDQEETFEAHPVKIIEIVSWIALFLLLIYFSGFRIGIPLYIAIYGSYAYKPKYALATAIAFTFVIIVLIEILLEIPLWDGLVIEYMRESVW